MKKTAVYIGLLIVVVISIFLHFYKANQIPPCMNADEVSFSYNAYSILKTGKDEYGAFLPLRLKSFEDYKLPLYTYLTIPIIGALGLNNLSTRLIAIITGIAYVPLIFFLARELFATEVIALIAAFLVAINPGFLILTRHAHEGTVLGLTMLSALLYLLKYLKSRKSLHFILTNIFLMLGAYSYQSGRIYLVAFLFLQLLIVSFEKIKSISKTKLIKLAILFIILIISLYPDIKYGLNRVKNLAFYNNPGFALRINEYMGDHPIRMVHNKLIETIKEATNRYLNQLSPDFFVINGDTNYRFGFQNLGLVTPIEYILFFVGLYFLFRNNQRFRYLLLFIIFISPISNALTWQSPSLIRSFILLFPFLLTAAYGTYNLSDSIRNKRIRFIFVFIVITAFSFYLYMNLDIYFNHYPKRAITQRAWQCGYKELASYIKDNYDKYDKFVITDRHGQPYIFLLYYLQFDPAAYQKQAKLSAPDRYGFGQIGKFDKFVFNFNYNPKLKKTVFIGYPDQFFDLKIDVGKIKKIIIGTEEMFYIYEVN